MLEFVYKKIRNILSTWLKDIDRKESKRRKYIFVCESYIPKNTTVDKRLNRQEISFLHANRTSHKWMVDDNETRRRVFGARKPLEQLVCFRSVERKIVACWHGFPRTKIDKLNWWHGIKLNKRDHRTTLPSLFVVFSDREKYLAIG